MTAQTIIYTEVDEAPALATYSLLPILKAYTKNSGIVFVKKDISLAGRIIANFPDYLSESFRIPDFLAELGGLVKQPQTNIIKLPNISASIPQLKAAITELQGKSYTIPDYPEEPSSDEERDTQARYDSVKGSAVNPVLRQGNSDRRAPRSVKDFARSHPPRMRAWPEDSATHVATMSAGDFRHNERSVTLDAATTARIEHVGEDGSVTVLQESLPLQTLQALCTRNGEEVIEDEW